MTMLNLRNTKALLIAFALTGLASVTQAAGPYGSCDPHNGGCRDKIMQYITCTVKEQSILLRSLPNDRASNLTGRRTSRS